MLAGLRGRLSPVVSPWLERWIDRRQPIADSVDLQHRNIYILPTAQGAGFAGLVALLWLMGTNYENNLVLAVAFLQLALLLASILLTHANLQGIRVELIGADRVFAGEPVEVQLRLSDQSRRERTAIRARFNQGDTAQTDVPADGSSIARVRLPTRQRGWLAPGRLRIESAWPLGLFHAWSLPLLRSRVLVYPTPLPQSQRAAPDDGCSGREDPGGMEELSGIDLWREGSGLQRIAWKQLAAGRGLYEKRFAAADIDPLWLDWEQVRGDVETRLSALCAAALECAAHGQPFGLRLPAQRLEPSRGDLHLHRVLTALALFDAR